MYEDQLRTDFLTSFLRSSQLHLRHLLVYCDPSTIRLRSTVHYVISVILHNSLTFPLYTQNSLCFSRNSPQKLYISCSCKFLLWRILWDIHTKSFIQLATLSVFINLNIHFTLCTAIQRYCKPRYKWIPYVHLFHLLPLFDTGTGST